MLSAVILPNIATPANATAHNRYTRVLRPYSPGVYLSALAGATKCSKDPTASRHRFTAHGLPRVYILFAPHAFVLASVLGRWLPFAHRYSSRSLRISPLTPGILSILPYSSSQVSKCNSQLASGDFTSDFKSRLTHAYPPQVNPINAPHLCITAAMLAAELAGAFLRVTSTPWVLNQKRPPTSLKVLYNHKASSTHAAGWIRVPPLSNIPNCCLRRSLGRSQVPVWRDHPLRPPKIVALVGLYPTNLANPT
ncbi:hypothetical protein FQR65_LT16882 [Abscondita terminalis]|nr:hypothetical protein FQR65_LT16882 [Abscondita terminalis]